MPYGFSILKILMKNNETNIRMYKRRGNVISNHELYSPNSSQHRSNKETNRLTREAICTALVFLIQEQSFSKITITDIVKRAGVSRTTLLQQLFLQARDPRGFGRLAYIRN